MARLRNANLQKTSDFSVVLHKKYPSFSLLQSSKGFKTKILTTRGLPPSSSGTTRPSTTHADLRTKSYTLSLCTPTLTAAILCLPVRSGYHTSAKMFSTTHFTDTGACDGYASRITPIFHVVPACSRFDYPKPAIIHYLPLFPNTNVRPVPSHYQQDLISYHYISVL